MPRLLIAALATLIATSAIAAPVQLMPKHLPKPPPARDFTIAGKNAWACDPIANPLAITAIFAGQCDTKPDPMGTLNGEPKSW